MRKIYFRGLDKSSSQWAYGCYMRSKTTRDGISTNNHLIGEDWDYVEVDLETMGQYTGIEDKNGVNVYEDDIVNILWYDEGSREPTVNNGIVVWDHRKLAFALNSERGYFLFSELNIYSDADIEVIGNIHENPELLDSDE